MNILIMADSHGKLTNLIDAYEREKPNLIIAAGDCMKDVEEFHYLYENIELEAVRGNCDLYFNGAEEEKILKIEGKKILITHGHLYEVKWGMEEIEKRAKELKVEVVIFGHTHIPYMKKKDGIYYFNPGSLKEKRYGVIKISSTEIEFIFKEL